MDLEPALEERRRDVAEVRADVECAALRQDGSEVRHERDLGLEQPPAAGRDQRRASMADAGGAGLSLEVRQLTLQGFELGRELARRSLTFLRALDQIDER